MQSNEILGVVDSVSTEKGLDKDVIFKAIEIAIASASQRHFHEDADLYVKIDRETGEYSGDVTKGSRSRERKDCWAV